MKKRAELNDLALVEVLLDERALDGNPFAARFALIEALRKHGGREVMRPRWTKRLLRSLPCRR